MSSSVEPRVLLLTRPYERNAERLASLLCWLGARPVVLSMDVLRRSRVVSKLSGSGESTAVRFGIGHRDCFDVENVGSVWSRGWGVESTPRAGSAKNLSHHQWGYYMGYVVGRLRDKYWMNSHEAIFLASNRLLQMDLARKCGFMVPESMVSNGIVEVRDFVKRNRSVVAKQISSGHPRECTDRLLFAAMVATEDLAGLEANVRVSPTLLQVAVRKVVELRAYVVGERLFCAAMRVSPGDHVDARSLITQKSYFRFSLDSETTGKIRRMVEIMGLRYAAIDMAIDSSGDIFLFEVNPSGQWGYVEMETGLPIGEAIAEELVNHART